MRFFHNDTVERRVDSGISTISNQGLALALLPTAVVIGLMIYWSAEAKTATYATLRMLVQLMLIGYVLVYIFETDQPAIISAVLLFMLFVSSWIAIRHVKTDRMRALGVSFVSIAVPGVLVLALVSQIVIGVDPWFSPRYLVPLPGMMTGQILSGISPLVAAKYQIVVMSMLFGVSGMSAAIYLTLQRPKN